MEACSADELALPAAYRRRPAHLHSVPSLLPCFILGYRMGSLGWFNSLSVVPACEGTLSVQPGGSDQFLMCFSDFEDTQMFGVGCILEKTGLFDVFYDH